MKAVIVTVYRFVSIYFVYCIFMHLRSYLMCSQRHKRVGEVGNNHCLLLTLPACGYVCDNPAYLSNTPQQQYCIDYG